MVLCTIGHCTYKYEQRKELYISMKKEQNWCEIKVFRHYIKNVGLYMVTYKFSHKIVSEYMGKKYIYTCPSEKLKYTFHVNNDSFRFVLFWCVYSMQRELWSSICRTPLILASLSSCTTSFTSLPPRRHATLSWSTLSNTTFSPSPTLPCPSNLPSSVVRNPEKPQVGGRCFWWHTEVSVVG